MTFLPLVVMEAVASTSMGHPQDADHVAACDICRAAAGDTDAMARIMVEVQEDLDRREREARA